MTYIDLNADIGESFGTYKTGNDTELLKYISSANIACGFHAGDPQVILKTVRQALTLKVAIGAHPSYPDLQGFGRRSMSLDYDETYSIVLYQVGTLKSIVESEGGSLHHVKPHGALYNDAQKSRTMSEAIVNACAAIDSSLIIYGQPNSEIENAALRLGMKFCLEAFADRAYNNDGSLVSRSIDNSVIHDSDIISGRVLKMVTENRLISFTGEMIVIKPDTICIHGDTPHAVEIAKKMTAYLNSHDIVIKSINRS